MKKNLTLTLLVISLINANAQTIYNVPVSGNPNTIIFDIKNDLDNPALDTKISVCELPGWIIFEDKEITIGKVPGMRRLMPNFISGFLPRPHMGKNRKLHLMLLKIQEKAFRKE